MFTQNPFATHTLEILIMLSGAFLLGLWLGWILWGRLKEELSRLRLDSQSLNATVDALRLETESLKTRAVVAETDNSNLAGQIVNLNREITSLRDKAAFLENEMAEVQQRNRQVETELGLSFTPDTPLADDIPLEIKTLSATDLTPELSPAPAPEPEAAPETPEPEIVLSAPVVVEVPELPTPPVTAFEPVVVKEDKPVDIPVAAGADTDRDDLTVIEGIGPKIQMLLNQYGIYNYRQLAETEVSRLKEVLAAAGPQLAMHDPGTWPSQANLAANDQWDTLKSVQGFLKGGKKPD